MILSDTEIIDNTHFEDVSIDGKGTDSKLLCYTVLPNGERFQEVVPDRETVTKNMIGWCNTVRAYVQAKEDDDLAERVAKKERRQPGIAEEQPPPLGTGHLGQDPKIAVIEWYEQTQNEIDRLGERIQADRERRDILRNERDRVEPIIKAWRGSSD